MISFFLLLVSIFKLTHMYDDDDDDCMKTESCLKSRSLELSAVFSKKAA